MSKIKSNPGVCKAVKAATHLALFRTHQLGDDLDYIPKSTATTIRKKALVPCLA